MTGGSTFQSIRGEEDAMINSLFYILIYYKYYGVKYDVDA
ncbi:hypothetical protein J2T58_001976 [Methanocalculus alkaliphilus]|nr:hypothetical protein [Methanocalculus alkaliphilus]